MRLKYFYILTLFHLLIACAGAFGFETRRADLKAFFKAYSGATGAGRSYGYFAPQVSTHVRARCEFGNQNERFQVVDFKYDSTDRFGASEIKIRFGTIVDYYNRPEIVDKVRYAASWAEYLLDRNPRFSRCQIDVEYQSIPTMAEYHQGARSRWISIDHLVFDANTLETERPDPSSIAQSGGLR